jgi:hypothetical protein
LTGTPLAASGSPLSSTTAETAPGWASTPSDTRAMRALPTGGVLALPPAGFGRLPGSYPAGGRVPNAGMDAMAVEESVHGVAPVQAGGRTPATRGVPAADREPGAGGLIGGGFGGGGPRPLGTHRRQYPADEEWRLPAGVEPVIQPDPEPDPRTAFDPGPNVIGGRR